jgi:hypothetical protein
MPDLSQGVNSSGTAKSSGDVVSTAIKRIVAVLMTIDAARQCRSTLPHSSASQISSSIAEPKRYACPDT